MRQGQQQSQSSCSTTVDRCRGCGKSNKRAKARQSTVGVGTSSRQVGKHRGTAEQGTGEPNVGMVAVEAAIEQGWRRGGLNSGASGWGTAVTIGSGHHF